MTKLSDMNTPEDAAKQNNTNENKQYSVVKVREKLVYDYNRRKQSRDYARILKEYSNPPSWYQVVPIQCSIYYYDPQYQKLLQQHSTSPYNISQMSPSPRVNSKLPSRPVKHNTDLHSSSTNFQRSTVPSASSSVPTLPRIVTNKKK